MNTITLTDYKIIEPIGGILCPNCFESFGSACEPGIGRFLAYDCCKQIEKEDTANKTLKISSEITSNGVFKGGHSHSFDVQIAAAMPASIDYNRGINDAPINDMYELVIYDLRNDLNVVINKSYNYQTNSDVGLSFVDATLNGSSEYTWADVVSAINAVMPVGSFINNGILPTTNPRNLVFNSLTVGRAIQIVAAQTFMQVGYDHATGIVSLYDPSVICTTNAKLFAKYDDSILSSYNTDALSRNSAALPKNITCSFPLIYEMDVDDDDKIQAVAYEKVIEVNAGGIDKSRPLHLGNYPAIHDGVHVTNSAALDVIAAELADRAFDLLSIDAGSTYVYPMVVPFVHDGYVRAIKWTNSSTTIQTNNDKSSNPLFQISRNVEQVTNSTQGIFAGTVSGTPSGSFIVPASGSSAISLIPKGLICMWSGAVANIPDGWSLCDGGGGTGDLRPDLRGRFIVGCYEDTGIPTDEGGIPGSLGLDGDYAAPGETGGKSFHGITENGHPDHVDHTHEWLDPTYDLAAGSYVGLRDDIGVQQTLTGYYDLKQRHGGTTDGLNSWVAQDPVNEAHPKMDSDNRPAFFTLAYIIKD